jgi:hypothetical protein
LWRTNRSEVARGDRVAIYKYKGRDAYRGVLALGEVLTDPVRMSVPPGTDPYEPTVRYGREPAPETMWARIRYVRPPRMPLWAGLGGGSVVDELAVRRAQGGTVHRVTAEQWDRLLEESGQVGWPPAESPDADAVEEDVTRLVRGHVTGQGPGLTAADRALVEQRAMDVVTRHFAGQGWDVDDVSEASPYDLLCWQGGAGSLRVEVKGTTGQAAAVILTRNEVLAARADPDAAVLAIVHGITLDRLSGTARGGRLKIISPWRPEDRDLTPIAYRYQVP